MKIKKAFKVKLYPNKTQAIQIDKTIDACRFIYNKTLEERNEIYKQLNTDKESLYSYKYKTEKQYKEDFPFLKEVSSYALQQCRRDLQQAYINFYRSFKKKGKTKFPKFKSKKICKLSYREPNGNFHMKNPLIYIEENKIALPKLGKVKFRGLSKYFNGKIINTTITKEKTGEYIASILVEQNQIIKIRKANSIIGIDLGLKEFATCSNGEQINGIKDKLYDIEKDIKKLQKHFARKQNNSNRKEKLRIKIAKKYKYKNNVSNHFNYHLANKFCNDNQIIGIENLNVSGMLRNRKLAHSISYASWDNFINKLEQKAEEYKTQVVKIDRFYPSSKTCSKCNKIKENLSLADRMYVCECGNNIDRDLNASINIKNQALKSLSLEFNDYKHGENIKPIKVVYNFDGSFQRSVY